MNKFILSGLLLASSAWLSGCTVTSGSYYNQANHFAPAYNTDFVYSVGYYGYRPYWGSYYENDYWVDNDPYWVDYSF